VGIDVGLESFATLPNREMVENPRLFGSEEKGLAEVQRKLSKVPKGTPERIKVIKVVGGVHEMIANLRLDFANKVSCELADRFSGKGPSSFQPCQEKIDDWKPKSSQYEVDDEKASASSCQDEVLDGLDTKKPYHRAHQKADRGVDGLPCALIVLHEHLSFGQEKG
jgi:hypothetical protein